MRPISRNWPCSRSTTSSPPRRRSAIAPRRPMTPDLDPDRRLALAYAPARARPALEALWRLDVTLGAVVARAREKMVARIRLAWWREALERLDAAPPPAEPLLEALAA